ncbi:MAG: Na(+)/H(+) antiporter subunit B [Gammaproteobacteria bacterium]|nr:Na(+)/H(+) antiporter subunit B [Gammaproteobacteria bacterium]
MRRSPIVKEMSDLLIPAIVLFGLYVQFHGDFGPGGGFQAGVIVAAGVILYALVYGLPRTQRLLPPNAVRILTSLGLLLYAGVGFATIILGSEYLNYDALHADKIRAQHIGIILIEFGVGTTVAAVMISFFYAFAGRGRS